jgi:hypothetical protein
VWKIFAVSIHANKGINGVGDNRRGKVWEGHWQRCVAVDNEGCLHRMAWLSDETVAVSIQASYQVGDEGGHWLW